jgi:hypothetical protein
MLAVMEKVKIDTEVRKLDQLRAPLHLPIRPPCWHPTP